MRKSKKTTRNAAKRSSRRAIDGITFEPLETRQLMAVINVADFGARPNDGANDLSAIKSAISASKAGDTILFDGGTFDLSGELTISGDRTYKGTNGATLKGRGGDGQLITLHQSNVTFTGLTFDGGGVFVDSSAGGMNDNIVFDSNVFKINTSGLHPSGITFTSGLQNSKITNNYFTGYNSSFGIYGYNYNTLTIANNEFVNVRAGMHIDAFGNSGNLLVEQNYMTGLMGMGMEFQSTASNLVFQDNWYENPNLSTTFNANNNSMAYSLILDKSSNITIRRNVVIAPQRPDGVGCRIGFEVGGDNTLVEDNYVNGINHVLAVNDGVGSASVTVRNNKFMNYLQGASNSFPAANRTWTNTNNGPSTTLSSTMEARIAASAKPVIGSKRYGSGGTTTSTPPVVSTPTAPVGPTGLAAIVTASSTVNLFWTDRAYDETGYKVERSTDGTTWTTLATLGPDAAGYTATGLTAGQAYSFRVRSFNAGGNSAYSNTASVTPNALTAAGTYVSDVPLSNVTNLWGPLELDKSNGEALAGDGKRLLIGGKAYTKGLGVHAGSEVHVTLGGKYSSFVSDIGLDDETKGNGSVVFEVWADGTLLYTSGAVTAAVGRKSIEVDLTGKQELTLKVTNAGDNNDFDHADWADAMLLPMPPTPPPVEPPTDTTTTPPTDSASGGSTGAKAVYVSDLEWASISNGWGTPERDKSNGERRAGDGKTITLNGKTYAKGLGVNSTSDIRYSLDGKYSTFTADIGIDDVVGNKGSVVFQVWGDRVKLYDSGMMTGASATKSISVDVQGKQELWLVVTTAGDNRDYDRADWADAKLTAVVTAPAGGVAVSTLTPISVTNGWGAVETNTSVGEELQGDGTTLKINGRAYTNGLGVHSDAKLVYNLNGQYTTFTTDLGIDDEVGDQGSVTFQIWADGVMLYDSGIVTGSDSIRTASVNVAGKSELWLVVSSVGDSFYYDHADWANARLVA